MILAGERIRQLSLRGPLTIGCDPLVAPFNEWLLNPASYDLTLGDEACVYTRAKNVAERPGTHVYATGRALPDPPGWLDAKRENNAYRFGLHPQGFRVDPGRIYLMHTVEVVAPGLTHVAVVDGKSSLGRLGLVVHATAGYVDPGFRGQVTLEVACLGEPVVVYPGMRIAQVRFQALIGEAVSYAEQGHYTGEAAKGPVPSRSYQQFQERRDTLPSARLSDPPCCTCPPPTPPHFQSCPEHRGE